MIQEQDPHGRDDYRRTETMGDREGYETSEAREHQDFTEPRTRQPDDYERADIYEPRPYGTRRDPQQRSRAEMDYGEPRSYRGQSEYAYEDEAPEEIRTVYSTSGINIIAGFWLLLAPFALGYSTVEVALWNSIILGLAIGIMAIIRVVQPDEHEGVSWVNFVLGIWLLVSPFALGLTNIEWLVWNNIIVGIVVIALAAVSAMATHRYQDPTMGTRPGRRNFSTGASRSRSRRSSSRW